MNKNAQPEVGEMSQIVYYVELSATDDSGRDITHHIHRIAQRLGYALVKNLGKTGRKRDDNDRRITEIRNAVMRRKSLGEIRIHNWAESPPALDSAAQDALENHVHAGGSVEYFLRQARTS